MRLFFWKEILIPTVILLIEIPINSVRLGGGHRRTDPY